MSLAGYEVEVQRGEGLATEEMTLNMGPQHPSTHGVLRFVVKADGEVMRTAIPDIGYQLGLNSAVWVQRFLTTGDDSLGTKALGNCPENIGWGHRTHSNGTRGQLRARHGRPTGLCRFGLGRRFFHQPAFLHHLFLEFEQALGQSFGPGRTAWHIHINRNHLIHPVTHRVGELKQTSAV